ncbi:hypothetical protein [Calidifontibacter terrae]
MATKIDFTPIYAAVGVADTALTTVRDRAFSAYAEGNERVQTLRAELKPSTVQARFTKSLTEARTQIEAIPATATSRIEAVTAEAGDQYVAYAERGAQVVKGVRKQVEGIETTTKKQAAQTRKDATARFSAGRKDAAKLVAGVAGTVEKEARQEVRSAAAKEGAATRPARKTVARKATAKKAPAKKATPAKATVKATPAKTAATTPAAATTAPKTDA